MIEKELGSSQNRAADWHASFKHETGRKSRAKIIPQITSFGMPLLLLDTHLLMAGFLTPPQLLKITSDRLYTSVILTRFNFPGGSK